MVETTSTSNVVIQERFGPSPMNLRNVLVTCGAGVFLGVALAASWLQIQWRPDVVVEPPLLFSADAIKVDAVPVHGVATERITVTSNSAQEIRIRKVSTTCGCSSAKVDRDRLTAGASATLTVTVSGRPGLSAGKVADIFIETDDRAYPSFTIPVYVAGATGFVVMPSVVDFGLVSRGSLPAARMVYVVCKGAMQASAVELICEPDQSWLTADQGACNSARNEIAFSISLTRDAPTGNILGYIELVGADSVLGSKIEERIAVRGFISDSGGR